MSTPRISGITTNSKYNIFAENKDANDAVRVGYVHPRKGYISGLTVYAANKYAEANPGTQFIIANRDGVKYININKVNKLTNRDTLPTHRPKGLVDEKTGEFDPCNTVRGFKTDPTTPGGGEPEITPLDNNSGVDILDFGEYNTDKNYEKYSSKDKCRTRIELQGGGGIGALAVPIVGTDGSILHVRMVHGGFGYKFPPQVRIFDDCKRGSGASGRSELGATGFRVENFDDEDDFEFYDFKLGQYEIDISNLDWGKDYSMSDQTVIGEWNPSNILSLEDDQGFGTQLQEYLRFLKGYDPNKPWWTTRDETPVNVVGDGTKKIANKLGGILFPVEHWAWGGSNLRDDLFVDVEFEVYGQGTYKNRNISFKFVAEDGSHQFRVRGVTHEKRSGKRRTQLVSLKANTNYSVTSNVRKVVKNADSLNVEQGLLEEGGRAPKEGGELQRSGGKSKIIFADVVGSANDNDDIQVMSNIGSFRAGSRKKISFDTEGIQNKNIKIKKNIDSLEARQTDLLRKLEVEKNDAARDANDIIFNKVDAVTAELQEEREKKKELRKKLKQIEANKKNRYQRGTFDLTYRLNRRKDKTFTTEITDSFMNRYAVAPQLPSDREGTDKADKPYSLMYKEYFPHDGQYTFKGAADNVGEVFFDNVSIMNISNTFKKNPVKKKLDVLKGEHEIRIDLLNAAQKKIITETYTADSGQSGKGRTVKFNVVGSGSGRHRKISAVFTNYADVTDNFTINNDGENKKVRTVYRKVTSGANYHVKFIATAERVDENKERITPIQLTLPGTNGRGKTPAIVRVENKKIRYTDSWIQMDTDAKFKIVSTSPGISAKFSRDGSSIITKGNGDVSLELSWDDDPNSNGKSVGILKVGDKTFKQTGKKGNQVETINLGKKIPKSKDSYLEQGCIENGTKNKESRGSSNRIFADYIGSANDNDDMQIFTVKGGIFTSSDAKRTPGVKEGGNGRNTFNIDFVFDVASYGLKGKLWQELKDANIVDDRTGESLEKSDIEKSVVFNTKQYIDKANRPLFRVRPSVGGFGDFFAKNAVTPFNPLEIDPEIKSVPPTVPKPQTFKEPKVKFHRRGGPNGELFMEVIGDGKAKIGFKLKVDDSLTTSGLAVRDVKIESDDGNIDLKRNINNVNLGRGQNRLVGKEKEKIKGSGEFTAGKSYKVIASGGSSTSGFKTVDNTIVFDDDFANGWDKNAGLEIDYIRAINPPKSEPAKPPKNGKNNSSKKSLESIEGSALAYAGTHEIVWRDVEFPASGTYNIDVQVDDNVRLEIFNNKFRAQTLDIKGFRGPGKSNGLQTLPLEVKKGKYTIKAFLQQLPGKSIVDGNPMGLAVIIKTAYVKVEKEIIIRRSWNQNPFGAALTIHAPPPPIPQEPPLKQDGPCPPNPIWTTRHEAEVEQWHPCSHRAPSGRKTWSKFMNRYAMSPVLPIGVKGSGYSGQSWDNTWLANIPYTGFYNFKGTVDNRAKCTITQEPDNSEVTSKTVQEIKKINGFRTEKSKLTSNKIFLEKGKAQIDINVTQGEIIKYRQVTKKVFHTKDWVTKSSRKDRPIRVPVEFKVYGQGSKKNMDIKAIFKEKGGDHTFTINNVEKSKVTESITKKVKRNTDYKVTFIGTPKTTTTKERVYPIEISAPGTDGRGKRARIGSVEDKKIKYLDEDGDDPNATLSIKSASPGVNAKFSRDGSELIVNGNGDVTLKLKWDDDPKSAGIAVGELKVGGKTFRQKGEEGDQTETITVGNSNSSGTTTENITKIFPLTYTNLNSSNNPIEVTNSGQRIRLKDGDGSDQNAVIRIENVEPEGGTAKFTDDGRGIEVKGNVTVTINLDVDDSPGTGGVALDAVEINGVTFNRVGSRGEDAKLVKFNATKEIAIKPIVTTTTDRGTVEQGTLSDNKFGQSDVKNEQGQNSESNTVFADVVKSKNDNNDMMIQCTAGIFTPSNKHRTKEVDSTKKGRLRRRGTWDLTFRFDDRVFTPGASIDNVDGAKYTIKDKELSRTATTRGGGTNNSRIVENTAPVIQNPTLTTYRRGTLGPFLSPFFPRGTREGGEALQGRTWEMVWENVDFPIDGNYKIEIEADDILEVLIGTNLKNSFGQSGYKKVATVSTNKGVKTVNARVSSGKHDIKLILNNLAITGTTFEQNPTVAACKITCEIPLELADQRSWLVNPVGISAVLLAPPCNRVVGGIGTVTKVIMTEPGNTYTSTQDPEGIPSQLILKDIIPLKPGIGYTPGDTASIVGIASEIPIEVGDFGKIVKIISTPTLITTYPQIDISTSTGTGLITTIDTELIVDTPAADPDTVIQVTDLAGLKQTGYVEGRAYYGEVFFKDGTPFAGRYETAGKLIQVYATLQESIDSEVTTRPSAIQRSGTDVNSNNPRLNIPGTPNNLA